jgi:fermentation-respiration switch protein FrsA (DUF1100 family)
MTARMVSLVASALSVSMLGFTAGAGTTEATLMVRGRPQALRLYGPRGGPSVVVSSGDGGWLHLAPHVAAVLSAHGFFVVGFDSRAYLASFTTRDGTLREADVPEDYRVVTDFAGRDTGRAPVLVGVSEGAGLSVLAASCGPARGHVRGVVAVGLPEQNELGWRWRDATIYLTHGVPHEPLFDASAVVAGVSPIPLAVIHSTRDEFVPPDVLHAILAHAGEPKRVWPITASNHSFTDNLGDFDRALAQAMDWIARQAAPPR